VRSDFPGAAGIPRQLDHVPFDLNRLSPLVIAGLDPAIHAEKTLRGACRNVSRVKPAHEERDYSNPNEIRS
jgi:hypothetical protein